jgi:hypothetical protein
MVSIRTRVGSPADRIRAAAHSPSPSGNALERAALELVAELARKGYEQQYDRFAAAMSGETGPVEQLAAFAAAYVEFAADNKALFDITFGAGLKKQLYRELARAGDRVLDLLRSPASRIVPQVADQDDLITTIGATAHGFAAFLTEGILGEGAEAVETAKRRARAAARCLATDAM